MSRFHWSGTCSSVPIPKFASLCGTLACELRNPRDTSKCMILVRFLDLKFLHERAAKLQELQIHRTRMAHLARRGERSMSRICVNICSTELDIAEHWQG